MTFDLITLILGAAVLLLAALSPFLSPFFRKFPQPAADEEDFAVGDEEATISDAQAATDDNEAATEGNETANDNEAAQADIEPVVAEKVSTAVATTSEKNETSENKNTPALTLLITAQHKQAPMLRQHLPEFLNQEYDNFEVVVVAEKGDSDTEDVINSFSSNSRLYATYVPDSSRYMSKKKLAITLGVKAAHNEWIVLVDAFCTPSGPQWLATIASYCDDDHNLVIGYNNFDNEAKPYYRFERLQQACYTMREALRTAYRSIEGNIAFRKSEFIAGDGYRGNLQAIRGEYDFLINKYAKRRQTAVAAERNAWVIYDAPTPHAWRNMHIFYTHTRKLLRRSFRHRLLPFIDELALHLTFIAAVATGVFAGLTQRWILLGVAVFSLLLTIILRTTFAKKVIRAFDEDIPSWKIYPYELSGIWHKMFHHIRYWRANKTDFTSHKV
ncbi:MAG: glycosyltransferase [Prevotella sp.]|nr:glycosyltransferase [Prevotella sp.]